MQSTFLFSSECLEISGWANVPPPPLYPPLIRKDKFNKFHGLKRKNRAVASETIEQCTSIYIVSRRPISIHKLFSKTQKTKNKNKKTLISLCSIIPKLN